MKLIINNTISYEGDNIFIKDNVIKFNELKKVIYIPQTIIMSEIFSTDISSDGDEVTVSIKGVI